MILLLKPLQMSLIIFLRSSKRKLMFSTAMLVLVFHSFGQTNFREGYYITWDNDTIYGLIDYRGDARSSQRCVFKSSEISDQERFEPGEILGYRFANGKFYVSKEIETHTGVKNVFLEFLVNGITNLYFFRDMNNYKYFLEDKNGNMLELTNESITSEIDGKAKIQRNSKRYIGLLKASFADSPEILAKADNVSFGHKALINITKEYHDMVCFDEECIIYEKVMPSTIVKFAPTINSGISFNRYNKGIMSNYDFSPAIHYGAGMLLSIVLPGVNENVSFDGGLDLNRYNFHGSYQVINGPIKENYDIYFALTSLQPSLSVKYTFPKGKVKPTVGAGAFTDIFLSRNERLETVKQHSDTVYNFVSHHQQYVPYLVGGFIQLGCNYQVKDRDLFTNLRISYSTKNHKGINTIIQSVNLKVGIFLNKRKARD